MTELVHQVLVRQDKMRTFYRYHIKNDINYLLLMVVSWSNLIFNGVSRNISEHVRVHVFVQRANTLLTRLNQAACEALKG